MVDIPVSKDGLHRLRSVSLVSGFLDGQRFDLSDGLNCIVGACCFSGTPGVADASGEPPHCVCRVLDIFFGRALTRRLQIPNMPSMNCRGCVGLGRNLLHESR